MKITLAVLTAIIVPGGFLILAIGAGTYLAARYRTRGKAAKPVLLA